MMLADYTIGSRGPGVAALQKALKDQGFDPGAIDGVYGNDTRFAVLAFQSVNGLQQDGIAGAKTLAKLGVSPGDETSPTQQTMTFDEPTVITGSAPRTAFGTTNEKLIWLGVAGAAAALFLLGKK